MIAGTEITPCGDNYRHENQGPHAGSSFEKGIHMQCGTVQQGEPEQKDALRGGGGPRRGSLLGPEERGRQTRAEAAGAHERPRGQGKQRPMQRGKPVCPHRHSHLFAFISLRHTETPGGGGGGGGAGEQRQQKKTAVAQQGPPEPGTRFPCK